MLDAMLPNMLAVLYTGLMFYLIKKKKWSTYKLVIFTIIVGILLSVIGISLINRKCIEDVGCLAEINIP